MIASATWRDGAAVVLSTDHVAIGGWVTVSGRGFQPGELVLLEVCGSHVSSDLGCDATTAIDAEVDAVGSFAAPLHIARPPAPCPCTVRVRSNVDESSISTPLDITDMDWTDE